ncbi:hypothetical protein FGO68_gene13929 [Halteria grandinella]|uniref:Glycine cleavage system H protein n=1 Tax=Halteria grandinella TaxID=5974 RepID=A0A8J8NM35_HALGN|nr:hypothetical protein FGO68_gene13929 [Halteria grandinella]
MLKRVPTQPLNSFKPLIVPLRMFTVYKKFTKEHDWLEYDTDTREAKIGLTNRALQEFGYITHVNLPKVGTKIEKYGDIYDLQINNRAPAIILSVFRGEIKKHNPLLKSIAIDILNNSPETEGWILSAEVFDRSDITDLMDEGQYQKYCESLPKILVNDSKKDDGVTMRQFAGLAVLLAGYPFLAERIGGDAFCSERRGQNKTEAIKQTEIQKSSIEQPHNKK